jgi:Mg-chelatase subunit ChlI
MLSKRLPSILPSMTREEALEVSQIYSVMGLLSPKEPLLTRRPFRSPHHTISNAGLAGGGTNPKPGEISMAHQGVLFLDELPEFHKDTLDLMRQPLEDGQVTISRVAGAVTYPAEFMLVCAMNPCKCGWYGDPSGRCTCSENSVRNYRSRISGPLLDRIDIVVEVPSVHFEDLRRRAEALPYTRHEQPASWMLKGLVRCSSCGSTLVYQALACPSMQCHKYAHGACRTSHSLSLAKANRAVIAELRSCADLGVFPVAPRKTEKGSGPDFARLIAAEEAKLRRVQAAYEDGVDSLAEYRRKKTRLTAGIEDLRRQQKAKSAEAAAMAAPADLSRKVLDVVQILESPEQSEQAKNTALRSILSHIVYDKPNNQLNLFFRF